MFSEIIMRIKKFYINAFNFALILYAIFFYTIAFIPRAFQIYYYHWNNPFHLFIWYLRKITKNLIMKFFFWDEIFGLHDFGPGSWVWLITPWPNFRITILTTSRIIFQRTVLSYLLKQFFETAIEILVKSNLFLDVNFYTDISNLTSKEKYDMIQ